MTDPTAHASPTESAATATRPPPTGGLGTSRHAHTHGGDSPPIPPDEPAAATKRPPLATTAVTAPSRVHRDPALAVLVRVRISTAQAGRAEAQAQQPFPTRPSRRRSLGQ